MSRILIPFLAAAFLAAPVLRAEEEGSKAECHSCHHGTFAFQAQILLPLRDLKEVLDNRTGLGLGGTWTREHSGGHASRTRLEWNVFPEGHAVAGVKTQISNYTLALDHLYRFKGTADGPYLVAGLGAVRWFSSQEAPGLSTSTHTTKLTVQGGAGWRFNQTFGTEFRYAISSMDRTMDANMVQACVNFRF